MKTQYHVEAVWDPEAGVFYAKSDIPGLHVEAETLEAFVDVVKDVAAELIVANEPQSAKNGPKAAAHHRSVRVQTDLDLAFA